MPLKSKKVALPKEKKEEEVKDKAGSGSDNEHQQEVEDTTKKATKRVAPRKKLEQVASEAVESGALTNEDPDLEEPTKKAIKKAPVKTLKKKGMKQEAEMKKGKEEEKMNDSDSEELPEKKVKFTATKVTKTKDVKVDEPNREEEETSEDNLNEEAEKAVDKKTKKNAAGRATKKAKNGTAKVATERNGPSRVAKKAAVKQEEVKSEDEVKNEESEQEEPEEDIKKGRTRAGAKKRGGSQDVPVKSKIEKLNPTSTPGLDEMDFDCKRTTADGKRWNLKISTWNVAGLRACVKKGWLEYVNKEQPDILCLQETKCSEKKSPPETKIEGYHQYWATGESEGNAGVALLSKEKPLNVSYGLSGDKQSKDGRIITAEYKQFYLVTAYVPNSGQGLKTLPKRMEWDESFRNYLKDLDSVKPVILCGDLNVAHNEIDLKNPKSNTRSAGFTKEERDNMTELLKHGFIDSYRHIYPDTEGAYTFWTYLRKSRANNTGWRLDYFVLSERFLPTLCDNVMRTKVMGSDHCPVTLFLHV